MGWWSRVSVTWEHASTHIAMVTCQEHALTRVTMVTCQEHALTRIIMSLRVGTHAVMASCV